MAQPTAYNRNEDFTQRPGDETNHTALNSEFDAAAQSINQIRANLALLQADSGGLKPEVVGPDQLSQAARDSLITDVAQATADAQSAAASAVSAATAANSANTLAQAAKSGAETAAAAADLNAQAALSAAQSVNAENLVQKSQNLSDIPDKAAARNNLGLGSVNNTPDADKPISVATQNALNLKQDAATSVTKDSDKGSMALPVGTTAQRSASPNVGRKRWNSDLGVEETFNGAAWVAGSLKFSSDGLSASVKVGESDSAKFTQGQAVPTSGVLDDAATVSWNCANNGQVVSLTIAGNRTMAAPANVQQNAMYLLRVTQDATGSRTLAWNSEFKFGGSGAPTLTTTAGKTDILSFVGGAGGTLEFLGIRKNAV